MTDSCKLLKANSDTVLATLEWELHVGARGELYLGSVVKIEKNKNSEVLGREQ